MKRGMMQYGVCVNLWDTKVHARCINLRNTRAPDLGSQIAISSPEFPALEKLLLEKCWSTLPSANFPLQSYVCRVQKKYRVLIIFFSKKILFVRGEKGTSSSFLI